MAVVLSGPLWARLGSVCKENMVFSVLGVQKYLPQSIWVEICRHRKLFSVSAQCDLAETANAPAPSLQASPYIPVTKLPDFFFFTLLYSVHKRCTQEAGCSDLLKMLTLPLRPANVRFSANVVFQALCCYPEINCIWSEALLNLAQRGPKLQDKHEVRNQALAQICCMIYCPFENFTGCL